MFGKASNDPVLKDSNRAFVARARNQFSSMSVSTTRTTSNYSWCILPYFSIDNAHPKLMYTAVYRALRI